jgi:hypothetical protein
VDSIVAGLCEGFEGEFIGETFRRSIKEMFLIWRLDFIGILLRGLFILFLKGWR